MFAPPSRSRVFIDTDLTVLGCGATNMRDEEWIKTLGDGRRVKFIYQELPDDGAFVMIEAC